MNREMQVSSAEASIELRDLGEPQGYGIFYWVKGLQWRCWTLAEHIEMIGLFAHPDVERVRAFTTAELGERISGWDLQKVNKITNGHWQLLYPFADCDIYKTEAEARARLRIEILKRERSEGR